MSSSHKVTTVHNGRREVWSDYEEAKSYFHEMMMTTEARNVTEQNSYTFSYSTDLMSVAANDQLCYGSSPLLCPVTNGNVPQNRPSLRSGKLTV